MDGVDWSSWIKTGRDLEGERRRRWRVRRGMVEEKMSVDGVLLGSWIRRWER